MLAKREIARNWKSKFGPKVISWRGELLRWADCEGAVLMREAKKGRGSVEKTRAWEALLDDMRSHDDSDEVESQAGDPDDGREASPVPTRKEGLHNLPCLRNVP